LPLLLALSLDLVNPTIANDQHPAPGYVDDKRIGADPSGVAICPIAAYGKPLYINVEVATFVRTYRQAARRVEHWRIMMMAATGNSIAIVRQSAALQPPLRFREIPRVAARM